MSDLTDRLRMFSESAKRQVNEGIDCPKSPLMHAMLEAADRIEGLEADLDFEELESELTASRRREGALQARLDVIMMEFCPDEMTPEQLEAWGINQVPYNGRTG